jgi:dihydroxyacid dehydratase/phosphogluconate dehydratase
MPISTDNAYELNKMNSVASKTQLGTLISNIQPSHVLEYAGSFTTVGGDATESITVTGALSSDLVIVVVKTAGATPRSVVAATAASNAITVTMSGDPSTDHVLHYFVFRAAA